MKKILVGGQALRNLGSNRHTEDQDYLIFDEKSNKIFTRHEEKNIDYLNASAFGFFKEIYKIEEKNEQASPNSLLELKCYALVQHLLNGNWKKATDCEFDIAFLIRECDAEMPVIVKKYVTASEWAEILKEVKSVKK